MTEYQLSVIRCALADLIGSRDDWYMQGCNDSYHDWAAHEKTIKELATAFDMTNELPESLR